MDTGIPLLLPEFYACNIGSHEVGAPPGRLSSAQPAPHLELKSPCVTVYLHIPRTVPKYSLSGACGLNQRMQIVKLISISSSEDAATVML